ncbi:hypothetical protein ACFLZY_03490 [Patescibacteria group bacterium]
MWRYESNHQRGETEYFDTAIRRLESDFALSNQAEAILRAVKEAEPLLAEAFKTPQSPIYHAEGPVVEDHLRLMLTVLYGLSEEKFHLIDVEEFRRLRGYEGEIDEMEEIIKENISLFEVYVLAHDAAKWATCSFSAPKGSRGEALGFDLGYEMSQHQLRDSERAKIRQRYLELYHEFASLHPNESQTFVQSQFFLTYRIEVRYPGHGRAIRTPVFRQLLHRLAKAHRLPDRDLFLLEDLIVHHMKVLHDFRQVNPSGIGIYLKIAKQRGYDGDDWLDLLQAAMFLDIVCGSKRRSAHGTWHEVDLIVNFLRSEHDYDPQKRVKKEEVRHLEQEKARQVLFRQAGLDGIGLMELLDLEPGPDLGKTLKKIQAAVLGQGQLPHFDELIDKDLSNRVEKFYKLSFNKEL